MESINQFFNFQSLHELNIKYNKYSDSVKQELLNISLMKIEKEYVSFMCTILDPEEDKNKNDGSV